MIKLSALSFLIFMMFADKDLTDRDVFMIDLRDKSAILACVTEPASDDVVAKVTRTDLRNSCKGPCKKQAAMAGKAFYLPVWETKAHGEEDWFSIVQGERLCWVPRSAVTTQDFAKGKGPRRRSCVTADAGTAQGSLGAQKACK